MNAPASAQRSHTYTLSRADIMAARIIFVRYSRLIQALLIFLAVVAGALGFFSSGPWEPLASRLMAAVILIVLALIAFWVIYTVVVVVQSLAMKDRGVVGAHTMILTDEGLIERTAYNESLHRWNGFSRVRQSSRYLFLFLSEERFFHIPKRSFASDEEMRSFFEEIKGRVAAASDSTV